MSLRANVRSFGVLVCGASLALALSACSDGTPELRSGNNQAFVEGDGTVTVIAPADREPAPELSGTTLQGKQLSLSDFDGDVIVINVWGSWCAPCRAEAPALEEVASSTAAKGVQFVGVNTRDDQVGAVAFEDNFGISYPSLSDPSGQLQLLFTGVLPLEAIPSTLVVDRDGNIAARVVGPTSYNQLTRIVREVAAEGNDSA